MRCLSEVGTTTCSAPSMVDRRIRSPFLSVWNSELGLPARIARLRQYGPCACSRTNALTVGGTGVVCSCCGLAEASSIAFSGLSHTASMRWTVKPKLSLVCIANSGRSSLGGVESAPVVESRDSASAA